MPGHDPANPSGRGDAMLGQPGLSAYLHRPREELYDREKGPHECKNVTGDPARAPVLAEPRRRMARWQKRRTTRGS